MILIKFALCLTILFMSGSCLDVQAKYVFKPGSRQAIWVPDNQSVSGVEYTKQGYTKSSQHTQTTQTGGMSASTNMAPNMMPRSTFNSIRSNSLSRDFTDFVQVQGFKRPFSYHLPTGYNKSRATPVMLVFAGLKMKGTDMIGATGMNGVSNRNNFIVVYGEPVGGE